MEHVYKGDKLRALRTKQNLKLSEMSEITGLSISYVSDLERGAKPISKRVAQAYAPLLKTQWWKLMS